jgi:hypothetical protein
MAQVEGSGAAAPFHEWVGPTSHSQDAPARQNPLVFDSTVALVGSISSRRRRL